MGMSGLSSRDSCKRGGFSEHGACPSPPTHDQVGNGGECLQLTTPQADGPDEETAQREGGGHTYAACHSHHHPVVEADAGPAAELRAGEGGGQSR